ncbi:HtaA domain-containing protein [Streptomyces sp. NPDC049837]|uniref:HtaA domain-containing protein n=1 Tax=Streptomyces sp. NPDC049837 TaxID=3155277 RepID=UPI00342E0CAA
MPPSSGPARTQFQVLALAVVAALAAVLLPATTAQAADRTVQGGRLDWGIKSSFQSYVTGPIAHGSWSLTGGAGTTGGSRFRFHSAQGSYDPDSGAFDAAFSGGVHFLGHRKADGTHQLDLTVSRPRVRAENGNGTLYADVGGRTVPFASLDLSGIDMRGGGSPIALTAVPATLTAEGARAFAGYYTAGTPLDPVSLSVDLRAPRPSTPSSSATATEPSATATEPSAAATERPSAGFRDAAVDWGVRRTFREYVTGPVAKGRWTLSGGAQDGGALFRFPRGTGTYDPRDGTLDAGFAGSVRFTGSHLDLTLTAVAVHVKGGRGTLSADVTSAGRTDKAVPLVTFAAGRLAPANGLAAVTEAPAILTARGAEAFGGMYRAGTAMDPVSLAVAVGATARVPALPDLGSDTPSPAAAPRAGTATGSTTTYVAAGAAALLVAALTAYAVVRRRRTRIH